MKIFSSLLKPPAAMPLQADDPYALLPTWTQLEAPACYQPYEGPNRSCFHNERLAKNKTGQFFYRVGFHKEQVVEGADVEVPDETTLHYQRIFLGGAHIQPDSLRVAYHYIEFLYGQLERTRTFILAGAALKKALSPNADNFETLYQLIFEVLDRFAASAVLPPPRHVHTNEIIPDLLTIQQAGFCRQTFWLSELSSASARAHLLSRLSYQAPAGVIEFSVSRPTYSKKNQHGFYIGLQHGLDIALHGTDYLRISMHTLGNLLHPAFWWNGEELGLEHLWRSAAAHVPEQPEVTSTVVATLNNTGERYPHQALTQSYFQQTAQQAALRPVLIKGQLPKALSSMGMKISLPFNELKQAKTAKKVALLGPSGAGKTLLLHYLVYHQLYMTKPFYISSEAFRAKTETELELLIGAQLLTAYYDDLLDPELAWQRFLAEQGTLLVDDADWLRQPEGQSILQKLETYVPQGLSLVLSLTAQPPEVPMAQLGLDDYDPALQQNLENLGYSSILFDPAYLYTGYISKQGPVSYYQYNLSLLIDVVLEQSTRGGLHHPTLDRAEAEALVKEVVGLGGSLREVLAVGAARLKWKQL